MTPRPILIACLSLLLVGSAFGQATRLSAYDRAQGWNLLFDGASLSDWRGYQQSKIPANWQIEDSLLVGRAGPALVTDAEYADFEFAFDWKVSEGGHGEVYFHVNEDAATPDRSGPVMQLSGHGAFLAGTDGLIAPQREIKPQFDVWYQAKLVVFGNQVEYWLNGEKISMFTIGGADWLAAVAASPYKAFADYALLHSGRIALSGDKVIFRNIKVRGL
jgi:hypothetical protein